MDTHDNAWWGAARRLALALPLASAIAAHAQITLDGTLGPAGPLAGPAFVVPADVGRQLGGNLFHSFGQFNLNRGESATFTGPASVSNILARVTGGLASSIDGALRSQIAGANLYLVNPAGLLLGPNATLDISGSFHVSSADFLRLGENGRFDAKAPGQSVLTSAPPSAFGFLGPTAAAIILDGTELLLPEGRSVSLIGGDIEMKNAAVVHAPGGRVNVTSLAGAGILRVDDLPPGLTVSASGGLGTVRLDDGGLNGRGDGGGTVIIRAGRFLMSNTALVSSSATGPTDGSTPARVGAGIDIDVGELIVDSGSEISSNVFPTVTQAAPPVRIKAGRMEVMNNSVINSVAMSGSVGASSGLRIEADSLDLRHGALIRSNTGGSGTSGDLEVNARSLRVRDGGLLFTMAFDGTGSGGDLVITAGDIQMSSNDPSLLTVIGTYSSTTLGNAGDIRITADRISLSPATEITSLSTGPRNAGNVQIDAGELSITGSANRFAGIVANTRQSGNAGNISIIADNVDLRSFASIQSVSSRNGRGGSIRLTGNRIHVTDNAFLYTVANGSGAAGSISLVADSVAFDEGAAAYAYSLGTGAGGSIGIDARDVSIIGYEQALFPLGSDFTGLNAATISGTGGSIRITASESVQVANRAQINSSSFGAGRAGTIQIDAPALEVLSGAQLLSAARGSGPGGVISVNAGTLRLSGVHSQAFDAGAGTQLAISAIASQTLGSAPAGRVVIAAGSLEVLDGARITTQNFGSGPGGPISINANDVRVSGHNSLVTDLLIAQGIDARIAEWSGSSLITADATSAGAPVTGRAGDVAITASVIDVRDRGRIMSGTMGSGDGGTVTLDADRVSVGAGGEFAARSTGTGRAGNIRIVARESFESHAGSVTTESDLAGGGNITFEVGKLFHLRDGTVATSVKGGGGDAGNIHIDPAFVVLNEGQIVANAFGGAGGNITIVANHFIASPDSRVEASSQLGIDGTVDIRAPQTDVGAGLEGLKAEFFDASAMVGRQCGFRESARASSFVVAGRGGARSVPDAPLSGSYANLIR